MCRLLTIATLIFLLAACSTVKPWQRGTLAEPGMAWEPDPIGAVQRKHIFFSKEAATGGSGGGGGGCGCN